MSNENPLLAPFSTPFEIPPFAAIEPACFRPAFAAAMAEHDREIEAIATDSAGPTFANVIEALERAGKSLTRVGGVFWNLVSSDSNEALLAIEREISPLLARHYAAISLNATLFARIEKLYQTRETLGLSPEQARLLELTFKSFVRAGAKLEGAARARFSEIAERLASLGANFSQNVLADESRFLLALDEADLAGLPQNARHAAAALAGARKADKDFAFSLSRSSVEPFLTFAHRRDLRETLFKAWLARGENGGETDNRALIAETARLRAERARMLGYASFADYKLDNTMAERPDAVIDLLDKIWAPARAQAETERDNLQALAEREGANIRIAPHDWRYYAEKLRMERYDLDQSELSRYFQLENMIAAAFHVAGRLFGLSFAERPDLPRYHQDVRVYEVKDAQGEHVGLFFGDYFARPSKRSGAWMSAFRSQSNLDRRERPIVVNVMNFPKPGEGGASLLNLDEVITLFHEFGHALHGILSDVTYPSMAGTAVPRDFVEFPSQLFEHWALRPEILQKFALHAESGAPMPQATIDRIQAARCFNQGFASVEFLASAYADFFLHLGEGEDEAFDVDAFERETLRRIGMPAEIAMRHRLPHFTHIFSGDGYAAGYYSYLWSEVLDADGFAAFEEAGDIFDTATALRLREFVYAAGNRRDPKDAYAAFRGRAPDVEALLRKKGFAPKVS